MKNRNQSQIGKLILLVILIMSIVGCASMESMFNVKEESRKSLPQIGSNTTVELDDVVYTASDIQANKVTIMGKGVVLTVIKGDWRVFAELTC